MPERMGNRFMVQWHVTDRCEQRCRHCYIYGKNKSFNGRRELSFTDCLRLIEDLDNIITGCFGFPLEIRLSGGDPLIREDVFELMAAIKEHSIKFSILGNPHLINDRTADNLYDLGIREYQMSMDGKPNVHDSIREKGSFQRTISAIQTLGRHGISAHIMTTIGRYNMEELPDIMQICAENNVRLFAFDLFVPNEPGDLDHVLQPMEIRSLMFQYREQVKNLSGCSTIFVEKNNLFTLLDLDMGIESELVARSKTATKICAGCSVGNSAVAILADGTVYPCRRLPIEIGKMPEQSIKDIFFGETMESLRHEEEIEKCKECELFYVCRGCRAYAYLINGSYFSQDPSCWKT